MNRSVVPEWLVRAVRPRRAPVPWAAAGRAVVVIAGPVAAGLAMGRTAEAAMVSTGAMMSSAVPAAETYRRRAVNIVCPQLANALGLLLGGRVHDHGWVTVGVLCAIGLPAGLISTIGAVSSMTGMTALVSSVMGAGLPMPGPWWQPPALFLLGGLLTLLFTMAAWPVRRGRAERVAVAEVYRAIATSLPLAGSAGWAAARTAVMSALAHAHDVLLLCRSRHYGRRPEQARLLALLDAADALAESATALHRGRTPPPAGTTEAIGALADAVGTGRGRVRLPGLRPGTPEERALRAALHRATAALADAPAARPGGTGDSALPAGRAADAVRRAFADPASWRYGIRLALCIGCAQALVSVIGVPRSYWIPLTVAFVVKPDMGSVFVRALLRALGTFAGAAVAAVLLVVVPQGGWDALVLALLAAALAIASPRGYLLQTMTLTPVLLLLLELETPRPMGPQLAGFRLLDSLIGCAIALVLGYALWPGDRRTRAEARLADTAEAVADHLAAAFGTDRTRRSVRLRATGHRLSAFRTSLQQALAEPPPVSTRAAAWQPLATSLERMTDLITAAGVQARHGAPHPAPDETAGIEACLRALADTVRGGRPHTETPPLPRPDGTLTDVAAEARTVSTILNRTTKSHR
ncbi:FUSC family protein [Streptomyces sp. AV19]|uniref:FUSC family protein n=1 Tax=Streptomyces sp. AV19 TaxID=2793068 RepID=UPI0018FE3280|nr:FUSC family protein [Streptomyces sp. AV19]MBH1938050.1 FUSC family protein [Streptomyces sp. AV19]MDG4536664.1 FUSC family protein [Streptomyces sp. AV19]